MVIASGLIISLNRLSDKDDSKPRGNPNNEGYVFSYA